MNEIDGNNTDFVFITTPLLFTHVYIDIRNAK